MNIAEQLGDVGVGRIDAEVVALDDPQESKIVLGDPVVEDHGRKRASVGDGEGEELADPRLRVADHVVASGIERAEIGGVESIRRQ